MNVEKYNVKKKQRHTVFYCFFRFFDLKKKKNKKKNDTLEERMIYLKQIILGFVGGNSN